MQPLRVCPKSNRVALAILGESDDQIAESRLRTTCYVARRFAVYLVHPLGVSRTTIMAEECPVCGEKLGFKAWNDDNPSDELCPGCGIQFGYNDARPDLRQLVYAAWRDEWIANGRQPFEGERWREVFSRVSALAQSRSGAV